MAKVTCIESNYLCTLGKTYEVKKNTKGNNVITLDNGKSLHAFRDGNRNWAVVHYGKEGATPVGIFKDI